MNASQPHYPDLKDASVLITGGATGIGAALVAGFAAQGAKVAFIDYAAEAGKALAADVGQTAPHPPLFLDADLSDIAALERACIAAAEVHGPVSVLVNNAARDDRHDLLDMDAAFWDANLAVNLRPVAFTAKAVAPGMIAAGKGAIVNFTSTAYMLNIGDMPAYTAAKGGTTGLTKALAGRLGPHGIRVNAIAPGWVLTDRQKELWATEEKVDEHVGRQTIERRLVPEDMVGPCLFLASDQARAISAQVLIADGGIL